MRPIAPRIRVVIDEAVFAALVKGEIAPARGVAADHMIEIEIILADIGFARMFALIRAAMGQGDAAVQDKPAGATASRLPPAGRTDPR